MPEITDENAFEIIDGKLSKIEVKNYGNLGLTAQNMIFMMQEDNMIDPSGLDVFKTELDSLVELVEKQLHDECTSDTEHLETTAFCEEFRRYMFGLYDKLKLELTQASTS